MDGWMFLVFPVEPVCSLFERPHLEVLFARNFFEIWNMVQLEPEPQGIRSRFTGAVIFLTDSRCT